MKHIFTGNSLDRGDVERRNEDWINSNSKSEDARYLTMSDLNPLVRLGSNSSSISWKAYTDVEQFIEEHSDLIFLGVKNNKPYFVIDLLVGKEKFINEYEDFVDVRSVATELPGEEAGILAQARAQLEWHRKTQYCSVCGSKTFSIRGGQVRQCKICKVEHFPRTDPVAIMLVYKGDKCVLGQTKARSRSGFYSCLAGFIDQGESIEEAVMREVKEEAGLMVDNVVYHSSQPWPFPYSLMIGCHARAITEDIRVDPGEMSDVRWFTKKEVKFALESSNPEFHIPGSVAIAHHLIRAWVYESIEIK